ncbi:Palmitoyltransferase PFA5 [Colletotrichum spinosum]|uniref:Palmitoyltransferase PFA5 n=1 Tax=Colletotrichum spinosum TaxID=1347390 RepID=A0A4R8QPF5_9PEZI|nr:Palmitoyltransferase PFA5 [Colletotrichum spinosum]
MSAATSTKCASRWVTRIIPIIITATSGYATYIIVAYLGVDYLYRARGERGTAIAVITIYIFFYLLTIITYLRTFLKVKHDPGLVPLGPQAQLLSRQSSQKRKRKKEGDLESQPYFTGPDQNPDSPGLEEFYSRDVFLAIRVPSDTPPGPGYGLITYPLPKYPPGASASSNATVDSTSPRDRLATRVFAIVMTEKDENPWDLGWRRNWTSIMGHSLIDWLLPIRGSPCAVHDSMESDYEMGPLLQTLRERHRLRNPNQPSEWVEMQEVRASR